MGFEIDVTDGLADEPLTLRCAPPTPEQLLEVRAELVDTDGVRWASAATFAADSAGLVDTALHPSLAGSYRGRDPGGLLWSMRRINQRSSRPSAGGPFVRLTCLQRGLTLATVARPRVTARSGVWIEQIRDGGVHGSLYLPAGDSAAPGVLVLGGWDGGVEHATAALLASRGYAALALAYFGHGALPSQLHEVPLEAVERGLDRLALHAAVDGMRLAILGCSTGADAALLTASHSAAPLAVVAYVPSGFVIQSVSGAQPGPLWSRDGAPLPYLSLVAAHHPTDRVYQTFCRALRQPSGSPAAIQVEAIRGPVLLVSAGGDGLWPSTELCTRLEQRLASGDPERVQHVRCPGAGHHLAPPPMRPSTIRTVRQGIRWVLGGTPQATAHARETAWRATLTFLRQHLSGPRGVDASASGARPPILDQKGCRDSA